QISIRRRSSLGLLLLAMLMAFPACKMNVKNDESGQEKRVDIDTPIGGMHISEDADPRDTGIAVYPGARRAAKTSGSDEHGNGNVSISTAKFGLRVVAVEFNSDDSPDKLIAFYKKQLSRYGGVLQCHTSKTGGNVAMDMSKENSKSSNQLKCDSDDNGNIIEL